MRVFPVLLALAALAVSRTASADLTHAAVEGASIDKVNIGGAEIRWTDLDSARPPGLVTIRFSAKGEGVEIPHCNGRARVLVDGVVRDTTSKGTLVVSLDRTPVFAQALDETKQ